MSTNRDVVTDAFRMLTVLDANETLSAEDGALGLRQLNIVYASLSADGADQGWPPQDSLGDDFPLDTVGEAQATALLAMRLHAFYPSIQLPEIVPIEAQRAMSQILRDAALASIEEADLRNLPLGESTPVANDILTDT